MNLDHTLQQRGDQYGTFTGHAEISQNIKTAMRASPNWRGLENDQREALEMVAHKAARILNGDPNIADSWHDIAGYAQLVAQRLNNRE